MECYLTGPGATYLKQAIDRTHRIGQVKKVFAYKMICRDTIEDKITQLRERKKSLSDNLDRQ